MLCSFQGKGCRPQDQNTFRFLVCANDCLWDVWCQDPQKALVLPCERRGNGKLFLRHKKFILFLILFHSGSYYFVIFLAFCWQPRMTEIISLAYSVQFGFILFSSSPHIEERRQLLDLMHRSQLEQVPLSKVLNQKADQVQTLSFPLSQQDF